jgi:SAM-dependent methyltransferase
VADAPILPGELSDLPRAAFEVIILWNVIEHVADPANFIEHAASRLKPGGWLVIETGNYQSADLILAGTDWYLWQRDHRWYLSSEFVQQLARQAGFVEFVCADTSLPARRSPIPSACEKRKSHGKGAVAMYC